MPRWIRISMLKAKRACHHLDGYGSSINKSTSGEQVTIMPRAMADELPRRDTPKFNPTILFNLFPSASMLYPQDFDDLNITTSSHVPSAFVMDRALLADRSAAFRGPWTGPTARTVAGAIRIGTVSRWWWEPIRRQILRYAGVPEEIIDRNLEGFGAVDPALKEAQPGPGVKEVEPLAPQGNYAPVVTYISRQSSRRRLTPEAHADLVEAVTLRSKKLGFEFVVVEAERMTKEEQFALAARTTVSIEVLIDSNADN